MYNVEFKSEAAEAALRQLEEQLGDLSQVMNEVGEELLESADRRWMAGLAPDGTPWAPKSDTTLKAYEKRGQTADPRPLIGPNVSGVPLRRSLFHTYGSDYVELGTNAIQAAVMQFGAKKGAFGTYEVSLGANTVTASIPWGDIPARPFLGISAEDSDNILSLVAGYLDPDAGRGLLAARRRSRPSRSCPAARVHRI